MGMATAHRSGGQPEAMEARDLGAAAPAAARGGERLVSRGSEVKARSTHPW